MNGKIIKKAFLSIAFLLFLSACTKAKAIAPDKNTVMEPLAPSQPPLETNTSSNPSSKTSSGKTAAEVAAEKLADSNTISLKLSNNLPMDSSTTLALKWFASEVKDRTNGRIVIQVYNNAALGDTISCLEKLKAGELDMVKADVSTMANYVDDYNALIMPYIYQDNDHFRRVHSGDIGMELLHSDKMRDSGFYGLTYYDAGTRCFYTTKKEIHSPNNMKGMRIRVLESALMTTMVETLGAKPVTATYAEVYSALQGGIVDAAENSLVNYMEKNYYEVAPYFIEDHHIRMADLLVMSEKTKAKFSAADLKMIEDTALESWMYQQQLWAAAEVAARAQLQEKQVMLIELSESQMAAFRSICEPMWYEYENGKYRELVGRIVAE